MPASKVVAIHQPNFFPWLGYFDKINRSDVFIIMDNAQFPKKGGNWSNRVRMQVNGQAAWVTMPVVRSYHGLRLINEMEINNATPWREKVIKTLQMNYSRAPFFKDIFPLLEELINNPTESPAAYNINAIRTLCQQLRLDTSKFVLGSSLETSGQATDLLISMIKAVKGTAYLSGDGAAGYQEDEKFAEAGLELIFQNFKHPVYPQNKNKKFVSGLSIVDALMHCGFEGTANLLMV